MKRLFDVLLALPLLVFTSPLIAIGMLAVRIRMGSPVLFRQQRPGIHGKPFNILKLRTMLDATNAAGDPLPDAERMTRLGYLLRASSIDELPALWNVVRGDMSLVGPRPLLMEYLPLYNNRQNKRHDVRPGVTGWAQVNGRNAISWNDKLELDVWYVENRSLMLDLKILLLTVVKVFRREGISADGHATMEKFKGSN